MTRIRQHLKIETYVSRVSLAKQLMFANAPQVMSSLMYKINFIFTKKGTVRFISHLDLMRLFMRALRRADLPIKMTEGFSPHPKLSIKRALKLGLESENEEATVVLKELIETEEFKERLQKQLPQGIEIKNVEGNFN